MKPYEYIVIGGGMIGSAIAYGLSRRGVNCVILDADDRDFRAAQGNFGLVWVQSKGADFPEYARLTRASAKLWPAFADELLNETGIDIQYRHNGGVHYCLTDDELIDRKAQMEQLASVSDGELEYQMLNHNELKELEPEVGADIPGGSWSANDGHVNPLLLLKALHSGFIQKGGHYLGDHGVEKIETLEQGYKVHTKSGIVFGANIILAAGLDNKRLAEQVQLNQPVFAQRGQVLVTERLPQFLRHPSNYLRQTAEGSIQIGDSKEQVGLDDGQSVEQMAAIAKRACKIIPRISKARIVRGWGALRILTEDGYPVYEKNKNAWAFSSHSGVTLAAIHALEFPNSLIEQTLSDDLLVFSTDRF